MQASRVREILIRALYNGRLMGDPIVPAKPDTTTTTTTTTATTTPTTTTPGGPASTNPSGTGSDTVFNPKTPDFKQCVRDCFFNDSDARADGVQRGIKKLAGFAVEKLAEIGLTAFAGGASAGTSSLAGVAAGAAVALDVLGVVTLVPAAYQLLIGQPFEYCTKKC